VQGVQTMPSFIVRVMQLSDMRRVALARKALRVSGIEICISFHVGVSSVA
jgi:hypothetical protein